MMQWNELKSHIRHINVKDQQRIQRAFKLGKQMHGDQKRKSGEMYFMHPIAVACILADMGADADTLIAALLHDTVEDTDLTLKEIDKEFNGDVAALIDGVTKLEPEDVAEEPTLNDQIESLRKMFDLMESDVRVIVIKLADRLHNMQTIEHLSLERQRVMARETMDVYVKVADRLCMQDLRDELEGLCMTVLDPQVHAKLSALQKKNKRSSAQAIRTLGKNLNAIFPSLDEADIFFEKKSWGKLQTQFNAGTKKITGLADVVVVFLCEEIQDCYAVLGALHQSYQRETLSFQDFINAPAISGYRGLHTTIIMESGIKIRCKIRTEDMHKYARNGIATFCFDNHDHGVLEYVPGWTGRIAPLSEDTSRRSSDFWESLQSDILGESIVIHGADDQRVLIPNDSTALDGAFYCYGKKALHTKGILVNGKDATFHSTLPNAASLSIATGKPKTVNRQWLQWVNTGLATALIRSALSQVSGKKKLSAGKELLQSFLTEHKKGYIEEFDNTSMKQALRSLGYESLQKVYEAISDGHLEPEDVYEALFEKRASGKSPSTKRIMTRICFSLDMNDYDSVISVLKVYKRYRITMQHLKFKPMAMMRGKVCIHFPLSAKEQKNIQKDFETAGVGNFSLSVSGSKIRFLFGATVLLLIWGFDPVMAHALIHKYDISTIDLSLIRFWSLAGLSGFALLLKKRSVNIKEIPVPIKNVSLWLSVLLMIAVSLYSYKALQGTEPVHYSIPMTAGGILLTTIVNRKRWLIMTMTWLFLILGNALIFLFTPTWSVSSMVHMLFATLAFSLFSVISERYKRQENIGSRAIQYFFTLSLLSIILTSPLLFVSTIWQLPLNAIVESILFSVIFAGLPYYMYYSLLSYKQIDFVLRYSFLIIFSTMLGQILFSSAAPHISPITILGTLIVTVGALLPILTKKINTKTV